MTPRDLVSGCLRLEKSLSGGGSGLLKSLKNNASFKAVSYLGVTKDRPCWYSTLATIDRRSRNFSQDAGNRKSDADCLVNELTQARKVIRRLLVLKAVSPIKFRIGKDVQANSVLSDVFFNRLMPDVVLFAKSI